MKKLYEKIFSLKFFKMFLKIPIIKNFLTYEMLSYLFFGVMTTVVNFVIFFVSDKILGNDAITEFSLFGFMFKVTYEDISTFIAWIFAVLFAYVTNKIWVFESKCKEPAVVLKELLSFFGGRVLSFALFESLGFMLVRNLFILTGIMSENLSKWIAKILMAVVVVIFNYVVSKLVIFTNNKQEKVDSK